MGGGGGATSETCQNLDVKTRVEILGRNVDNTLEALALLATQILPEVVELHAVPARLPRNVSGNAPEVFAVATERLVEQVHFLRAPGRD